MQEHEHGRFFATLGSCNGSVNAKFVRVVKKDTIGPSAAHNEERELARDEE